MISGFARRQVHDHAGELVGVAGAFWCLCHAVHNTDAAGWVREPRRPGQPSRISNCDTTEIRSLRVAGGGVTGLGILRGFAAHGVKCWLLSRNPAAPKPGLPAGVRQIGAAKGPAPGLLIESIVRVRPLDRPKKET